MKPLYLSLTPDRCHMGESRPSAIATSMIGVSERQPKKTPRGPTNPAARAPLTQAFSNTGFTCVGRKATEYIGSGSGCMAPVAQAPFA